MRIELEKLEEPAAGFRRAYEAGELPFDDSELRLVEPVEVRGRVRAAKVKLNCAASCTQR